MNEKTSKTVRLVYSAVLSAVTLIVGALLIWQTLDIYFTGTSAGFAGASIFTREDVGIRLFKISPALWIWLVMAVAGFVLYEVFKLSPKRVKPEASYTLARLKKRLPQTVSEDLKSSFKTVETEETILLVLWVCCGMLFAAAAIYAIVYLSTPSNFPPVENKSDYVFNMMKRVFPFIFAAFIVGCGVSLYQGISAQKQLDEVKKIIASKAAGAEAVSLPSSDFKKIYGRVSAVLNNKYVILGVRIAVGCVCVAFVIAGICNGGMHDMLVKAINICTECIGLG